MHGNTEIRRHALKKSLLQGIFLEQLQNLKSLVKIKMGQELELVITDHKYHLSQQFKN